MAEYRLRTTALDEAPKLLIVHTEATWNQAACCDCSYIIMHIIDIVLLS